LKDYQAAQDYSGQSLVIAQAISDLIGAGDSLVELGDALASQGKWDAAADAYMGANEVFEGFGTKWGIAAGS
jgi:hypothetical protein